ncbi:hypothetical protein O6H91_01G168800 [Diphasiastrum complanatum]|uniref:Uncharacterized protein n=1 Tax=Diphasiastrum complanatum TaxID=34168 RepID=A0ACC2EYT0_DIPCM|nr:hypothetical protein O6H91_01G168800 [Diphasiastrum complanatum]
MEEQQQQQQQAGQLTIVGPQFCSPYPTEYVIQKKVLSLSGGDFNVTDTNGNLFFKVDGRVWSMREKRVLLDALDTPVLCMKRKYLSLHSTWWAFLGNSISSGKELFTIKQSAVFQLKTSLDVFLAHNTGVPDFNIKGDFIARSCLIYHYNQVIAEIKRTLTVSNLLLGKDTFSVLVYPGIDSAFIISLVLLMDAIHHEGEK